MEERHPRKSESTKKKMACQNCRKGKVKCEGGIPCSRCKRKNIECSLEFQRLIEDLNEALSIGEEEKVKMLENKCRDKVKMLKEGKVGQREEDRLAHPQNNYLQSILEKHPKPHHLRLCQFLVEDLKFDPDIKNKEKNRGLEYAILCGQLKVAIYFIKRGVSKCGASYFNCQNKDGDTPLHLACHFGCVEVCKKLLENDSVDIKLKNNEGQTARALLEPSHSSSEATGDERRSIQKLFDERINRDASDTLMSIRSNENLDVTVKCLSDRQYKTLNRLPKEKIVEFVQKFLELKQVDIAATTQLRRQTLAKKYNISNDNLTLAHIRIKRSKGENPAKRGRPKKKRHIQVPQELDSRQEEKKGKKQRVTSPPRSDNTNISSSAQTSPLGRNSRLEIKSRGGESESSILEKDGPDFFDSFKEKEEAGRGGFAVVYRVYRDGKLWGASKEETYDYGKHQSQEKYKKRCMREIEFSKKFHNDQHVLTALKYSFDMNQRPLPFKRFFEYCNGGSLENLLNDCKEQNEVLKGIEKGIQNSQQKQDILEAMKLYPWKRDVDTYPPPQQRDVNTYTPKAKLIYGFLKLLLQMYSVVKRLHRENYIHRDVLPGNILLRMEGTKIIWVLSDLALCIDLNETPGTGAFNNGHYFKPPDQTFCNTMHYDLQTFSVVIKLVCEAIMTGLDEQKDASVFKVLNERLHECDNVNKITDQICGESKGLKKKKKELNKLIATVKQCHTEKKELGAVKDINYLDASNAEIDADLKRRTEIAVSLREINDKIKGFEHQLKTLEEDIKSSEEKKRTLEKRMEADFEMMFNDKWKKIAEYWWK
mmetsp:Transcript_47502/g.78723  ORF Transcript_47502/g.78723 Transcript_47502/m.78723 type:complete len:821 (+) Transcript_47502:85-2547(+)